MNVHQDMSAASRALDLFQEARRRAAEIGDQRAAWNAARADIAHASSAVDKSRGITDTERSRLEQVVGQMEKELGERP